MLFGKRLFGFVIGNSHVDEIVDFIFLFRRQGFNILDALHEFFIHDHISRTSNQIINGYAELIGNFFSRLDRGLDLLAFIPADDGAEAPTFLARLSWESFNCLRCNATRSPKVIKKCFKYEVL
jgi:hypothetical protein